MEQGKVRVGIVGCGKVAGNHLKAFECVDGVGVVCLYDVRRNAARALAAQSGAKVAKSLDEMVRSWDLDAVSICTPPAMHLESAAPFLEAGIAVYCEKPLEVDLPRALEFARAVRASRSIFMMGFNHRFHGPIVELRKLIQSGVLGDAILFRNIFSGWLSIRGNHRAQKEISGGGCLIDHGSHSIDLFRHLVGEPTHVQAFAATVRQRVGVEDFGMVHLAVEGRKFGEITTSYSVPCTGNWVEWHGDRGSAFVSYWNKGRPDLEYVIAGQDAVVVDCSAHDPNRGVNAMRHFIGCVRSGTRPAIGVEDGVAAMRIADAIYRSARSGRRVSLASPSRLSHRRKP